uniref:Uncharacterized protein n=1 Tax=Arundo donax TaxID=35708 RepID=A0A0A9GF15_ARUDO
MAAITLNTICRHHNNIHRNIYYQTASMSKNTHTH